MNQQSDPDLTGMALQALSKYQQKPEVKAATDRALVHLSALQNDTGGFVSWGAGNVESTVQVLVALCELGIPFDDPRFVKNGKTTVDNILSFRNSDGSYRHIGGGEGNNQMATEQALYGLVAAQRSLGGAGTLFTMTDAVQRGEALPPEQETPAGGGLPGKSPEVNAVDIVSAGKTFPDILSHANQPAIEALAERGIITGKSDAVFDPDATMTRAEFAAIVVRGLGLNSDQWSVVSGQETGAPGSGQFSDVKRSDWFFSAVEAAYFYKIVTGTSETTFNPGGTITRQETAVMVARAARLCGMDTGRSDAEIRDTLAPFGDYRTISAWAAAAMAFCFDTGILDDTGFEIKPTEAVQRCEIAEMLYRMLDKANLL
jgi:hypothetical protein